MVELMGGCSQIIGGDIFPNPFGFRHPWSVRLYANSFRRQRAALEDLMKVASRADRLKGERLRARIENLLSLSC